MIHVEIIVGCIAFGALYTLIFEQYKGKHFETRKTPRRPSERFKNK